MKLGPLIFMPLIILGMGTSPQAQENPLAITLIANEGFLISSEGKGILIDSLFSDPDPSLAAPSQELRRRMEKGQNPFDRVDLVLCTHTDPDHFDAPTVGRFLAAHPKTHFLGPPQAFEALERSSHDFAGIRGRVRVVPYAPGRLVECTVRGIRVKAMGVPHSGERPEVQHLMYLVDLNGAMIFHEGDAEAVLEAFQAFGLPHAGIRVAFLHPWYLMDPRGMNIVREALRPRHIVLMHVPLRLKEDAVIKTQMLRREFPNLHYLKESMEKLTL